MLKNLYTIAIRNLVKNKAYSFINIIGLSLGITCSLTAFLLVAHLYSFDRYHQHFDRIYRAISETTHPSSGRTDHTPGVPIPFPDAFESEFAGIEEVLFIQAQPSPLIDIEDAADGGKYFKEENGVAMTQSDYFKVLDRAILLGATENMLDEPNTAVISRSYALKYFGQEDVLGKEFLINKEIPFRITAVMEDHPPHTDFPFHLLLSFSTVKKEMLEYGWGSISSDDQCYVLLKEGVKPETLEAQFPAFIKKYFQNPEESQRKLYLQPLANLHFSEHYGNFSHRTVTKGNVYAILTIGGILLVICCINFINLSTAIAVKRAKEVGIRKVLGSSRGMLVLQMLGETGITTFVALIAALGMTELLLIHLREFLDAAIPFDITQNIILILFIVGLWAIVTVFSGFYPAKIMANYTPTTALKKQLTSKRASGGLNLRRALVVVQFTASQIFIIATLIVLEQMDYFEQFDLGFDKEAIVTVNLPKKSLEKHATFRKELERLGNVEKVSLASDQPASGSVSVINVEKPGKGESYYPQVKYADAHYAEVYGLEFLAGEMYPPSDSLNGFVINEKMMENLGFAQPLDAIGEPLSKWGKVMPITGVVRDFHTMSLRREIDPTMLLNAPNNYQKANVKLQSAKGVGTFLEQSKSIFQTVYQGYPFEYQIFDEALADFYESERKMAALLKGASAVAIVIGLLGLYGLVAFISEIKTKEIGIRKVLGASFAQVMFLLLKDFVVLTVIAFGMAVPLAWWGMGQWLESFSYHIEPGWVLFASGGIATLVVTLLVAGAKATKTANSDPVASLRAE